MKPMGKIRGGQWRILFVLQKALAQLERHKLKDIAVWPMAGTSGATKHWELSWMLYRVHEGSPA